MEHRQQLESLGCGVVVVGQNKDVPQAEEWNTSGSFYCDFIHFCDPDKVFYKAYGFDRSLAGVWGPVSLDFYVKEQQSGAHFTPQNRSRNSAQQRKSFRTLTVLCSRGCQGVSCTRRRVRT